jgi:hypothetical protein
VSIEGRVATADIVQSPRPTLLFGALVVVSISCASEESSKSQAGTADSGAAKGGSPRFFSEIAAESGIGFFHFNGMSGEYFMAEVTGSGGALLDYDNDGDLDIYLIQGRMLPENKPVEDALVAPRHPLPLTDRLYRNDLAEPGTTSKPFLRFTDVTEEAGVQAFGYGMGAAAGDSDNDGWVDLYVTNYGPNQMLRNNGDGTFTDVTEQTGTGDDAWSVPVTFFDYDRDGWLDLFVGNYIEA